MHFVVVVVVVGFSLVVISVDGTYVKKVRK